MSQHPRAVATLSLLGAAFGFSTIAIFTTLLANAGTPLFAAMLGRYIVASMVLLSYAAKTLPIGTAYGVWVGIGAAGAAVLGMAVLGEPVTAARIFFICLLLVAVVGLKATSGH